MPHHCASCIVDFSFHQTSLSSPHSILIEGSSSEVTAFYVDSKSVRLEAESSAIVSVDFLPFHLGKFQCSVLLINEDVGEFIYSVDATALLPVPSTLPYVPSVHSMRITSGAAAGEEEPSL